MLLSLIVAPTLLLTSQSFALQDLDIKQMTQEWGSPGRNMSVDKNPLKINGRSFQFGIGTHAVSRWNLQLNKNGERFQAWVGVDDETLKSPASVEFRVIGDGKLLWTSGVMTAGQDAKRADVDVRGVSKLTLYVGNGGDNINYDHADWCEPILVMATGKPSVILAPIEKTYILTPKPGLAPRLTGPTVFGARPKNPFLHTVTATGLRPMKFSALGLPPGLQLDNQTGRITGRTSVPGDHRVMITARNQKGTDRRVLTLKIGNQLALTPPMGWNSWNCWGGAVSQEKVLSSAQAMASKLKDHGWSYINVDDGWQGVRGGKYQAIQGNRKFPDIALMNQKIHDMGLKVGIYSTPWRGTYEGHIGGSSDEADGTYDFIKSGAHNDDMRTEPHPNRFKYFRFGKYSFLPNDVRQWAEWGFDYLKYDWGPWEVRDVKVMSDLLKNSGRDILYSLSNSAPYDKAKHWMELSHAWRTTGDITDTWGSVSSILATQDKWRNFGGPGHWNDPDMLVVGMVGWGPNLRKSRLSPNEQYAHISMWCLLAAPLLLGCDLAQLDEFTLNLLTNDEIISVNQDPLGKQAKLLKQTADYEIWAKALSDGSTVFGLFNKSDDTIQIPLPLSQFGFQNRVQIRDLWRQKSLGKFERSATFSVPRHFVHMIKVK